MSNTLAKLILEHAHTIEEEELAIEAALALGMPLHEIEEYLDWLDATRNRKQHRDDDGDDDPSHE